jgi:hydrogenase maturation protease
VSTIICLGNSLRGDDAAGLVVATRLRERGVQVLVRSPDSLLSDFEEARDVVVIDSVRAGAAAGTIHRLDPRRQPLPAGFASSTHLLGLADAVELARQMDRLPDAIEIIGIEGRAFELGAELTPAVERAIERVVDELASA